MKRFLLILLIFVVGCALFPKEEQQEGPQIIQVDNTTFEFSQDEIVLTVSTDKINYEPGEEIMLTAVLENVGDEAISYTRATPCDPDFDVYVVYSDNIPLFEKNYIPKECIEQEDVRRLIPGQKVTRNILWDQTMDTFPERVPVQPGKYRIITKYVYYNGQRDLTMTTDIIINGEAEILITKERALAIAGMDEELVQWYNAHLGSDLIFEEYGKYYLKSETGLDRIDDETAQMYLKSKPVQDIKFKDKNWIITYTSEYGPEPLEKTVLIDAKTGNIKS